MSRTEDSYEDILFYKSATKKEWSLQKVKLVPGRECLELRAQGSRGTPGQKRVVLLSDGFIAHAVCRTRSERLFEFNVAGQRGELRFAARSLEARDEWLDRLEALPWSRKARQSRSEHVFFDGRRTTRVDGIFASYLWKRTSWGQWRRRWFLLLAEKGELRYYKHALSESERKLLAERGDVDKGIKGRVKLLESSLWTEPEKNRRAYVVTRFAVKKKPKVQAKDWSWLLDARAEDLAETWTKKLQEAIDFARRRQAEERDFRRAVALSRFDSVASESNPSLEDEDDDNNNNERGHNSEEEEEEEEPPERPRSEEIFVPTRRPTGKRRVITSVTSVSARAPLSMIPPPPPPPSSSSRRRRNSSSTTTTPRTPLVDEVLTSTSSSSEEDCKVEEVDKGIVVNARSNGGRQLRCHFSPLATLSDLKHKIHAENPDFPPDRTRILYRGSPLDNDDATLTSLDVKDKSDVYFILRR
mmetsp:Transcript_24541/g.79325  ORF Transcript_24541/g.79325 Transcript_24541/m.79325 type:complete len:471 (+) Transcript_24541:981-2393(+)